MKKIFTLILLVCSTVVAFAQSNFYIYKTDGSVVEFVISEVDSIGFIAPKPAKTIKTLTFEDADAKFSSYSLDYCGVTVNKWSDLIPASDEQAFNVSSMIYDVNWSGNPVSYTWSDLGNTELSHIFCESPYGMAFSGGGIVITNMTTTLEAMGEDYNIYNHQLSIVNTSGHNGSSNYAIAYNDSEIGTSVKNKLSFADGKARTIKGMYVTIPAVTLFCMVNGSGFNEAFDDDDYLKLVATGKKADGTTSTVEILLADGNDYQTWALDWTYFDLSALGEVTEVAFHMEEAQVSDQGPWYCTPFYFAFDDVEVEF